MRIPKKHVLLTTLLVLVGMAASAAVAQAAIPIIRDTTTPPAGHSTAVCTECHVVTPTPIDLPGAGNVTTHNDTDSVEASDDDTDTIERSDDCTRSVGSGDADKATNGADHHDSASKGHDGNAEQAYDAQDASDKTSGKAHDAAEKAAEHETVDDQVQERDHRDTPSVDHGGAQHDGSHQRAEGSSD